jgi:hypothetical protein
MPGPITPSAHGGVRGATLARGSLLFDGPFGRIFRAVPAADYGQNDDASLKALGELGRAMTSKSDPADPKDGPDSEESGIPAAFTYFGQFIDHDLTFDPASSLQKQNDPDALVDYRTPQFDLDNVYGRGPNDQPYLYQDDGKTFVLGSALSGAPEVNAGARDLQRNAQTPARALIGDPRNDENVIVGQFQGLMHRFHNRVVAENSTWSFEKVQQTVRFHYQWVLAHDFLPTIIDPSVLDPILPLAADGTRILDAGNLRYFKPRDAAYMPLEFSAAAYRFGHSMVRPGYRLNDGVPLLPDGKRHPDDTLLGIFKGKHHHDLRGFKAPEATWAIDWRRLIDLAPLPYGGPIDDPDIKNLGNRNRLQLAYKIDTSLVNPLGDLPPSIGPVIPSLAERNLVRGWRMRLPNGQDVAKAMGFTPLTNDQIVIGKVDTGDSGDIVVKAGTFGAFAGGAFADNCPLWTYCLAETMKSPSVVHTSDGDKTINTFKLGPVGGTIVAETFVGLLLADSSSYLSLDPLWKPTKYMQNGRFGLRELIATALGVTVA